jgi:type I restriction enzyme S subunit
LAESFAGEWGAEPLPGNARVLRATDIDDEGHVIGSGALRRLPLGKLTSRQLEDGDILLEGSGGGPDKPVGRVAFFDAVEHQGPAVCSNFFKTLRPDRRVAEPRFLWRKLMWFYRQPTLLTFQQQTTGIINLKFEEYLNATIEVPADLAEQRVIAQLLDTLDTAIRETEALIDKLKAVKQGLLHDLLTRGIDANGQLRPPQSEAPQLYKESPLGWIPREWDVQSTAALLTDIEAGKSPSCPDTPAPSGSWGVLKVSAVHPDGFRSDQNKLVEHESLVNPAYEVHSGDLLITRANTPELVGMACLVEDPQPKLMLCDKTLRLLVNDGFASKEYLFLCLQQPYIRSQIESSATGTSMSMKNVSQAAIRNLLVAVAPLQEQIEISVRANVLALRLRQEMAVLEKLRQQKSGLMDDLLTGRVRVTPLLESVQQPAAQTGA